MNAARLEENAVGFKRPSPMRYRSNALTYIPRSSIRPAATVMVVAAFLGAVANSINAGASGLWFKAADRS